MDYKPHEQRVVDEKRELDEKLSKLKMFLAGDIFSTLPSREQFRLKRQSEVMQEYSNILLERITHSIGFEPKSGVVPTP